MKNLERLLAEYGGSHQNATNKTIHWICVPSIFFSLVGLLYSIKIPWIIAGYSLNVAVFVIILAMIYYAVLFRTLWIGIFLFCIACLFISHLIALTVIIRLWILSAIIFVLAWIGQSYGHKIEGKKPSFLKDLLFLLIGPAWLMSFVYRRIGIGL